MPLSDLPGFYPTIKDGGLGALPALNVSVFGLVGVSEKGTTDLKLVSDIQTIIDTYGMGSLVEHAIDAFICGARQIVIKKAAASVADVVGTPTKTGTGTATAAADLQSGVTAVKADRKHKFLITVGGALADAKYKYSYNNGITYSEEKAFVITTVGPPAKAKIDLEDGTYIEFTDDVTVPADSFDVGDVWVLENTESKMNTTDLGDALDVITAYKDTNGIGLPYHYIAASGDETFWAVLAAKADALWNSEKRPVWMMMNAEEPDYANIDTWIAGLETSSAAYRHSKITINAFFGRLQDTRGHLIVRAGGGCLAGLVAKAKPHYSIGWVREMVISNCLGIEPYNSETDQMDLSRIATLNDARFITARHWPGYGRVPTDDWMMAAATSDFFCIRNRRIMDAAINGVQLANTPYVNSPGVAKEDMIAYKKDLERPLVAMEDEGWIMDFTLTLTPDENIWTNGIVHCTIEIIPTPTKKRLNATFQLKTGTAAAA